ncbi:MAG: class I SAM-dependent methyltransferase [Geobacteraceae bacterium]|nr:class I SAM-dependent methyltransferase [Geobacteraceae bacterium]NTW80184.1 class I SAM-dependent methyltransferase [Geobacteraceae bacterium]
MNTLDQEVYENYFSFRNVAPDFYSEYALPAYLKRELPNDPNAAILDIGCGFGQMLKALHAEGYKDLTGIDISMEAIEFCSEQKLNVEKIDSIINYCRIVSRTYDCIVMSHVIEHIDKNEIIETLRSVRTHLLKEGGCLIVTTPNAQSTTGCYWAYEDFTHTTIFTSGSLLFVLKCAGFEHVDFIDTLGTAGSHPVARFAKRILIALYSAHRTFWNLVTNSSYHRPSPQIFTFELKAVAR